MAIPTITELVSRLFSDAELQERFVRNPTETIANLHLPAAERRSLLRLQARLAVAGGVTESDAGPLTGWP